MAKHVFISYPSRLRDVATQICRALESKNLKCWIAPRDVPKGSVWQDAIVGAVEGASAMVLLISADTTASQEIFKEVVLASSSRIPVMPVRVEDVKLTGRWAYELGALQWMDVFPLPIDKHMPELVDTLRRLTGAASATVFDAAQAKAAFNPAIKVPKPVPVVVGKLDYGRMIRIPPGEFMMGASEDEEGDFDNRPSHRVRISRAFELGMTPVTQAQYEALIGKNPVSSDYLENLDNPVTEVSWYDAVTFCNALSLQVGLPEAYRINDVDDVKWDMNSCGFRLPTEAEWEYACRSGTTGKRYHRLDEIAWYSGNSGEEVHPVAKLRPNDFGLYDMIGNVGEFCWDYYDSSYYEDCVSREAKVVATVDPVGPARGISRIVRGGDFCEDSHRLVASARESASGSSVVIGFRLARTIP